MGENIKDDFMFNAHWGLSTKIDNEIEEVVKRLNELRAKKNVDFAVTMQILTNLKDSFLGEYINGEYSTITVSGGKINAIKEDFLFEEFEVSSEDTIELIRNTVSEHSNFLENQSPTFLSLDNDFIKLSLDNNGVNPYMSLYLGSLINISQDYKNSKQVISISEDIDD